ncbi:hypothetical protein GCM10007067_17570 [Lysobacter bugurensis]|uniref:Uncharacterized protein n=1 Tax=Cognatilysobacter bugurensis TaxID=543356 RepID=A0A918SZF8_9GAMM|nr:hypothetical protein GCM10007067_17570 [Lysobacter bugurensis]
MPRLLAGAFSFMHKVRCSKHDVTRDACGAMKGREMRRALLSLTAAEGASAAAVGAPDDGPTTMQLRHEAWSLPPCAGPAGQPPDWPARGRTADHATPPSKCGCE